MGKRLLQMLVENKTGEYKLDELSKRCISLTKDKEDLNGQYQKSKLAVAKLESLCRELQKHNRLMKEECDHRTKVEEAKRQELSAKFQSSIGEITNQMQDNHSKNQQLKTDNAELASKLKGLVDQYEMREQYVEKVIKHKQVENQLLEAKLAQQSLIVNEEREQALKEKQKLLQESLAYQKKCEQLVKDEAELKMQLSMYTEKFEEFQKTLTKSNEVFGTFKKEMDKMTKTIKKLEKETIMWKQKWEKSNRSLLDLAGDNKKKTDELQKLKQKNLQLESLCRALQTERKQLLNHALPSTAERATPIHNELEPEESNDNPESDQLIQNQENDVSDVESDRLAGENRLCNDNVCVEGNGIPSKNGNTNLRPVESASCAQHIVERTESEHTEAAENEDSSIKIYKETELEHAKKSGEANEHVARPEDETSLNSGDHREDSIVLENALVTAGSYANGIGDKNAEVNGNEHSPGSEDEYALRTGDECSEETRKKLAHATEDEHDDGIGQKCAREIHDKHDQENESEHAEGNCNELADGTGNEQVGQPNSRDTSTEEIVEDNQSVIERKTAENVKEKCKDEDTEDDRQPEQTNHVDDTREKSLSS
ncbi:alpha-taxilin-like isoform X2 [Xenia sp. Carnegie-2017]|nr:alpha-taxilin-like isoform X2 [Xenia sp. Carnegie-2017]